MDTDSIFNPSRTIVCRVTPGVLAGGLKYWRERDIRQFGTALKMQTNQSLKPLCKTDKNSALSAQKKHEYSVNQTMNRVDFSKTGNTAILTRGIGLRLDFAAKTAGNGKTGRAASMLRPIFFTLSQRAVSSAGKELFWGGDGVLTLPDLERGHKSPTTARQGLSGAGRLCRLRLPFSFRVSRPR